MTMARMQLGSKVCARYLGICSYLCTIYYHNYVAILISMPDP